MTRSSIQSAFYNALLAITFLSNVSAQNSLAIDKIFDEWNRSDRPGGAVVVVKGEEVIFKKGYGMADLEHGISITPGTVFYAGSVSKQFVTTCIAILEERGQLQFSDPVKKYFPKFKDYGHEITLRHLIHHTSGIKDYFGLLHSNDIDYFDHPNLPTVLDLIMGQESLDFVPGDQYRYSNSGYLLLAQIVEKVSGMSFANFAHKEIFKVLGMEQSQFLDDISTIIPDRAWGYQITDDGQVKNMIMRFDLVGSGGLYTSVEDLLKWNSNFADNVLNHSSKQLIETLHTTGKLNDGSDTRYGMAISMQSREGLEMIGHTGSLGGYRAAYFRVPSKDLCVIILTNAANYNPIDQVISVANQF